MPTSPTVIRTRDDIVRDAAFMDLNTKRSKVLQKRLGFAMGGSLRGQSAPYYPLG